MTDLVSIVANTVTSQNGVVKTRIIFSPKTGLIDSVDANHVVAQKTDSYVYGDECLLFAGMGDIHIHAREDASLKNIYKEDFESACCAAINGGVVHVGDMPNNPIPPIDDESYRQKVELSSKHQIPILMYAGIGPSTHPLSYKVPYKAFMGPSVGDLFFRSNHELQKAISRYQGQWVSFHCEDPQILEESKSQGDHFQRRPVKAEILATEFALSLIDQYALKGKLCHYSSGEGLDLIIKSRARGISVLTEVTPQHLFFNEEIIRSKYRQEEVFFQMNPPIRSIEDQKKMLWALKAGHIDFLATDHAPHAENEKQQGISGMPGLDTYALFTTWLLNEEKFDPKIVARVASENPGAFFNEFLPDLQLRFPHYKKWGKGLGVIAPGYSASFTVLNLVKPKKVESIDLKSKAKWSPFLGHHFSGSLESVFVQGKFCK